MGGDYSRERFRAAADVSSVRMQQGRVQLDADWNELVDVVSRRFRAETVDLVGQAPPADLSGVAVYPRLTPDAFRIEVSGGSLRIGRGRMYVDGLLAENHGGGDREFDRVLDEEQGTEPLDYLAQPYFPEPPALPEDGTALAYLDVWEREVTHLQDPRLVESAVGVDTTTRLQTVWQVRLLPDIGTDVNCSTPDADVPGWEELTRPSGGRLTTRATGVPEDDEPCEIPPAGGYRGVENQLYRIQIHDGGGPGEATFKWSRENASVASGVVEVISPHALRLESLGRDAVLRLNTGDWVEIIDDRRELSGIDGDPARRHGEVRRIVADEVTRTITFSPDLPADLLPSGAGEDTADARHLLVRRWDQSGSVYDATGDEYLDLDGPGASGVIPVPPAGTALVLEAGIEVTFSLEPEAGGFRSGDYWTFAARTTDASVEELDEAPPRGTHHHFARLGVVTFPATVVDCRRAWPDLPAGGDGCSCTISICAEQFAANPNIIQEAVDRLSETGGSICLGAGTFPLGQRRIQVHGTRSITVRGQGTATTLVATDVVFDVQSSLMFAVEDLSIVVAGTASPAILLDQVIYGRYQRLTVTHRPGDVAGPPPVIGLRHVVAFVDVKECNFAADVGIGTWFDRSSDAQYLMAEGLQIDDNQFGTTHRGVFLEGQVLFGGDVRVARNRFAGCDVAAVHLAGASVPSTRVEVTDNVIMTSAAGIVAGVAGLRIDRNEITAQAQEGLRSQAGIILQPGFDKTPIGPVSITANRVRSVTGVGIGVGTMLTDAVIADNVVSQTYGGIVFAGEGGGASVAVRGNEVVQTVPPARQGALTAAIRVQRVGDVQLVGNTVRGVGNPDAPGIAMGILTVGCLDVSVTGNHISGLEVAGDASYAGGIVVSRPFAHADVSQNIVRGPSAESELVAFWGGIIVGAEEMANAPAFGDDLVTVRTTANRTVMFTDGVAAIFEVESEAAVLHENVVEGTTRYPVMMASVRGELQVASNRCVSTSSSMPAVVLMGSVAAVTSNRVRGGEVSLEIGSDAKASTVVGNITTGPIRLMGAPLAAPWAPLNVTG